MNYYRACQRRSDGRWDYTRMNDGVTWPVGYCDPKVPCACWVSAYQRGEIRRAGDPACDECRGTGRVANPDHCGSHDDAEAASACFARYLLDGAREEEYGDWQGCAICDAPTKKGLTTRPPLGYGYPLCDEHRSPEVLRELAPTHAGQITASY